MWLLFKTAGAKKLAIGRMFDQAVELAEQFQFSFVEGSIQESVVAGGVCGVNRSGSNEGSWTGDVYSSAYCNSW